MKKTLLPLLVLLLLSSVATAQPSIKVHSTGRISLQSSTSTYGIQIPSTGVASFEPNITQSYAIADETKLRAALTKAWNVRNLLDNPSTNTRFYVLGNGNVYAYGSYLTITPPATKVNGCRLLEGASDLVSQMQGYYFDSYEFDGITPEDFEDNENILPGALEGLLKDLAKDKVIGMSAEELENVLPEAVRHDNEGHVAINYNAVVTVLVEAFKEQQARIDQLEGILRENGLLKP